MKQLIIVLMLALLTSCNSGESEKPPIENTYIVEVTYSNGDKDVIKKKGYEEPYLSDDACLVIMSHPDTWRAVKKFACGVRSFKLLDNEPEEGYQQPKLDSESDVLTDSF